MICNHAHHREFIQYDKTMLYQCPECSGIFTNAIWQKIDPKELYKDYYKSESSGRFNPFIESLIKMFRFWRAFKITKACPNASKILDLGSGRGLTLHYLKKYYHYTRTAGTQISQNAYKFSRNVLGLEIYDKDLLDLSIEERSFDIVTIWHVLEHVPNPDQYIQRISSLLNDSGRLIIEVPNFSSWTRPLTGQYWLGLDLKHHMHFFTPQSLSTLLERHDFKVKRIRTFSLEYSTFLSAQSILSWLTKTDHIFFENLQTSGLKKLLNLHTLLFILLLPFCFLINLILYFSTKGEVLYILAERTPRRDG